MEKFEPLVSVVIPTYNRQQQLKKTIDSVLNQTYKNLELIVVDNCSDYNFIEFIRAFNDDRIKAFQNTNNGIIAVNRNFGIKKAKGEFIAFCDDDDWWYENKLEVCLQLLRNEDVVYHGFDIYSEKPTREKLPGRPLNKLNVFLDLYINRNAIPNSSIIIRKNLLDIVGGISEDRNLVSVEDYDCWLRIAQQSNNFVHINENLGSYYLGDGNMSSNDLKRIEAHKFLFKKFNKKLAFKDKMRAKVSQNRQLAEWYLNINKTGLSFYLMALTFRPWKLKDSGWLLKKMVQIFVGNK